MTTKTEKEVFDAARAEGKSITDATLAVYAAFPDIDGEWLASMAMRWGGMSKGRIAAARRAATHEED